MRKIYLLLLFAFVTDAVAQTTVTIQPGAAAGKDAELLSVSPTTNFGNWSELKANSWTFGGEWGIQRALLQFDLSQIPENATLVSAALHLYGNYGSNTEVNSMQSGSNSGVIQRVTAAWDESTVSWSTQPATTAVDQVAIPQTDSPHQDYTFDVTPLVQHMHTNPSENHGVMIRLNTESDYRRLVFSSSDATNAAWHPKLVVTYNVQADSCWTGVISPDGKDAMVWSLNEDNNYGEWPELKANAWTFAGDAGTQRSLFDFDFSGFPTNATVVSAQLSLYGNVGSATEVHSSQSGSNESYIRRVTGPWEEGTVTWSSQPATDMQNQVMLPQSTSNYQDYVNVDVTALVAQAFSDPANSHGFMFQLADESIFRRMVFKSGDAGDAARYPKLEICFNLTTSTHQPEHGVSIACFPNPFEDKVTVRVDDEVGSPMSIEMRDVLGRLVRSQQIFTTGHAQFVDIDTKGLSSGVYSVVVNARSKVSTVKVLKVK